MNPMPEPCGLQCPDGREAQLLAVQVHAEILGLMLRLTVRQTWRNASGAPMATRLNFPLAWDQTLLGLQMERPQGTQPLIGVTRHSRTRCSATPGVLATGEQVTLQWRIGQLLTLQGGSLRLQLPASLVPQAARPAQISLELHAALAHGTVGCASHELQRVRHANGMSLSLRAPQGLGKDLLLTVHGLRDTALAVASPDLSAADTCTVLLSASPRLAQPEGRSQPLHMKLLVDSSSAMPTERLAPLRCALDKLLTQLRPEDQLSYSRFGEHTVHDLPRLQVCTEAYQRRVRTLARHTDTDLGAAKPLAALQAALAITDEDEQAVEQADILLITASPLWAIDAPLRALRTAGHRLHVMTLGAASESLWRELAEASGGACETLASGQHSLATLTRLLERMRQAQPVHAWATLEVADGSWPCDVQTRTQAHVADGDTLHLWASAPVPDTPQDLIGHPQLHAQLHWQTATGTPQTWPRSAVLWDAQGDLARLCAARDALLLADDSERQALLARHGLSVPDSGRLAASATSATSATSTATQSAAVPQSAPAAPLLQRPKVLPSAPSLAAKAAVGTAPSALASERPSPQAGPAPLRALRPAPPRHADLAGWLGEPAAPGNPLLALVQGFNAQAATHERFRAALSGTLQQVPTRFLDSLVLQLSRQAGNPGRVWALLLHWLQAEHGWPLAEPALALLDQELSHTPVAVRKQVFEALGAAAVPVHARQAA